MMEQAGRQRLSMPLLWLLVLLPVAFFYGIVAVWNTGLPTEDDFHGLFGFVVRWHDLHGAVQRLLLILSFQHNEYKMPLPYSLLGAELSLTHSISIPLWIWAGNLLVPTLLVPLWLRCAPWAKVSQRLLLFAPVVWIVMSLGYAETVDFALSGLQVVLVSSLGMMSIYLLTRNEARWNYLGCVAALLACMTYANAFLLAPIGLAVLWRKRRWGVLVAWLAAFLVSLAAFLYRYTFVRHARPGVLQVVPFFLNLAGGSFGFHSIYVLALPAGVLLLLLFGYMLVQRADRLEPFGFWTAVWLLLGFALTTYGRASAGAALALSSRYKLYSDLFMAVLYLQVVALWHAGRLPRLRLVERMPAVIALAVLFGLGSDALGVYRLHARWVDVTYGTARYVESGGAVSPLAYPQTSPDFTTRAATEEDARDVLTRVLGTGMYRLPESK